MSDSSSPMAVAREQMRADEVDVLLLGPGADLRALTGYNAHPLERMTLLVLTQDAATLVVPGLELAAAEAGTAAAEIVAYDEGADSARVVADLVRGLPADATIAVGDQLWAAFLLELQTAVSSVLDGCLDWIPASSVTRHVRMAKDDAGLAGLRRAGAAIDAVHRRIPDLATPGMTEAELGVAIDAAMRTEGHDAVDFVIVASGPNGASPHHETSPRRLEPGEGIVIDIGGPVGGWFSDCTRNYVVGTPSADYQRAHDVLQHAQRAAVEQVRPGVTAASVDAAARDIIADAGFGDSFIHRTGHGIGLEVHEEPYITADSDLVLTEGMTFSVEPGIYLPGRFGMRIEDIVAVTAEGAERLNTTATDLTSIAW